MRSSRWTVAVGLAVAAGILLRLLAVEWNVPVVHGDVQIDVFAVQSLRQSGALLSIDGGPLAQHGPVWAMLGAAMPMQSAYGALQFLSLLSGLLVLLCTWILGRALLSARSAGLAVACVSLTYLLIDYSGNGSFYMVQTALYLLWIVVAIRDRWRQRPLLLGLIAGIAYLVNFQSIVLLPVTMLFLLLSNSWEWKRRLIDAFVAAIMLILVASPWLIRNAVLFGDPLHSHAVNQVYLFTKAGLSAITAGGSPNPSARDWLTILQSIAFSWGPNNLYYATRKLLVILPVLSILFAYGCIDLLFDHVRFRRMFPLLLVLAAHTAIAVAWPVMKFRYVVPMVPLVTLGAIEQLAHLPVSPRFRHVIITLTFAGLVIIGFLTYRSVPTHTAYYDGAVTQDAFHGFEERTYLENARVLPSLQP